MSQRDQRFVAVHRGGPLDRDTHRQLAGWAATSAERVLPLFEAHSTDPRPRQAISTARAWAKAECTVGQAQKAAVAAHAAARDSDHPAAVAAARAAGHASATAHMADHSLGAVSYALKAMAATNGSTDAEKIWHLDQAPSEIRPLIESALPRRFPNLFPPIDNTEK